MRHLGRRAFQSALAAAPALAEDWPGCRFGRSVAGSIVRVLALTMALTLAVLFARQAGQVILSAAK